MMSRTFKKRMITAITVIFGTSFLFGTFSRISSSFAVTPEQHLAQAEAYMKAKNWDQALAELTAAEGKTQKNAELHLMRGNILRAQGKRQEAIVEYDRVQAISPQEFAAYQFEAQLYRQLKRPDKVTIALDEGLKAIPGHPALETQRGIQLSEANKKAEAQALFESVIKKHFDYPDAHYNLAVLLQQQGEDVKARDELIIYLRLKPNAPEKARIVSWMEANQSALGGE